MIKVICVNGAPRSGKTTFENYCIDNLNGFGKRISSVDFVKDVAQYCGWNGEKTPENRKFLADLKQLLINSPWGDIPLTKVKEEYRKIEGNLRIYDIADLRIYFLFIDVREPEELMKYKKEFNAKTLLIKSKNDESNLANQINCADVNVFNFSYDYIIENNSDLKNLKNQAIMFIEKLKENKE